MANVLSKTLQSRWTFVAIIVMGLALRLVVWAVAGESLGGGVTETNGDVAVRFASGEMFDEQWHPYRPPGLSLYLAAFYRLFGADDAVTTAAMLTLYVVLSLAVYGLASVVMDRLAANLAALVVAITPSLVVLSLSMQASLLVAAALVGGAALTLRASGPRVAVLGLDQQGGCLQRIQTEVVSHQGVMVLIGLAVVAKRADSFGKARVVGDHHAAVARPAEVLGGVEAQRAHGADRSGLACLLSAQLTGPRIREV